jgi:hypothetical protein
VVHTGTERKMKKSINILSGALLYLAILSLSIGTSFWWVLDIAEIKLDNGIISISYWDSVKGSGAAAMTVGLIRIFIKSVSSFSANRDLNLEANKIPPGSRWK